MKNKVLIYLYGTAIIFGGVFLLFSEQNSFNTIRITLGITLTIGAILSFLSALTREREQVEFAYHEMHALVMLVYGVSVLMFAHTLEILTYLSAFLFFFYAFSEIIFCYWLFDLKKKTDYKIVLIRVFLGLFVGVGTIVIMHYYHAIAMEGFGALFIFIGINIWLYVPIMKNNELKEAFK